MKGSGILQNKVKQGNAIVTSLKNREHNLRLCLPSWLNNKNIDQIVILDWDSSPSLESYIQEINSEKLVYARIDKQNYYYITQATNLAVQFANYDKILFLNSDIILKDDFFEKHSLSKGIFYAGNWRLARNENETHLNGQFYVYREDFLAVNGYDERLKSYGWDDTDLYNRLSIPRLLLNNAHLLSPKLFWSLADFLLSIGGLRKLDINPDSLEHIPHDDLARIENYPQQNFTPKLSIQENRKLTYKREPWSKKNKQAQYYVRQVNSNYFSAVQIHNNFFAVKPLNGLGNRLRVLASSWAVAEALGKKLYVCWSESSGFSDEEFKSLFSADFEFISEEMYRNLEDRKDVVVLNKRVQKDEKYTTLESGYYQDYSFWTSKIDNSNLLYEWSNSLDHFSRSQIKKHPSLQDFDRLFEDKLRQLTPAQNIENKVLSFYHQKFSTNKVLGVHIRRGDAVKSPWAEEYKVSTDDGFAQLMEKEIEKDKEVKFFLSTDCPSTLEKFKNLYPDRLIHYEKEFVESKFGEKKQNQSEALVEMLLLSKTSKIMGTRWSTFSEMASKIGGVELEICG